MCKHLSYHSYDGNLAKGFWFRLYEYGVSISKYKDGYVPFSIRYGHRKVPKVLGWYVEFLKP
jgi:hypothetical protein